MSERDELRRLRIENRKLKQKLYKLETRKIESSGDTSSEIPFSANNYFSYLLSKFRQKSFYSRFAKIKKYFTSSLWITRIFRFGVLIYQYLQAGAIVIISTAAFILIVPIILSFAAVTLSATLLLRSRNAISLMKEAKKEIVFVIPQSKDAFNRIKIRRAIEENQNKTVLVVSPFFFNRQGLSGRNKMYVCYRKEEDNVYILRNYFFFYFRKRLKKSDSFKISETFISKDKE